MPLRLSRVCVAGVGYGEGVFDNDVEEGGVSAGCAAGWWRRSGCDAVAWWIRLMGFAGDADGAGGIAFGFGEPGVEVPPNGEEEGGLVRF